jgi:hypothetical protein
MKEIPLRDLLGMADPDAHEGIGELWNQKTIHYLVVFTSADADFEIIGAGPTLPYPTLEAAGQHLIPGKMAEYYVKCPGAIASRMQPKLAPGPGRSVTPSPIPMAQPIPAPSATPVVPGKEQAAGSIAAAAAQGEPAAPRVDDGKRKMEEAPPAAPIDVAAQTFAATSAANPTTPNQKPETRNSKPETDALASREKALAQREQELAALFDTLKIREASLRERETAIAAIEQRLLKQH